MEMLLDFEKGREKVPRAVAAAADGGGTNRPSSSSFPTAMLRAPLDGEGGREEEFV